MAGQLPLSTSLSPSLGLLSLMNACWSHHWILASAFDCRQFTRPKYTYMMVHMLRFTFEPYLFCAYVDPSDPIPFDCYFKTRRAYFISQRSPKYGVGGKYGSSLRKEWPFPAWDNEQIVNRINNEKKHFSFLLWKKCTFMLVKYQRIVWVCFDPIRMFVLYSHRECEQRSK